MFLDCCVRESADVCHGIALDTIFHIDGDKSYMIPYKRITPGKIYIVYTLDGKGCLRYNGKEFTVAANEFLYMRPQRDFAYHCAGSMWRFWWYEFTTDGPVAEDTLFHCAPTQTINALLPQILNYAKQNAWDVASALLVSLLSLLRHGAENDCRSLRDEALVRTVESYIRENLATVTVGELPELFGLEERTLRNLFYRTVELSPKRFILKMRVETVGYLLLSTDASLESIALQTGFSSQYHMSQCFSSFFGIPPSQYRKYIHS